MGENGFLGTGTAWDIWPSPLLYSRPNSSLSFSKAAPAGSLSQWKPLRSLKVQKKWKRRAAL